MRNLSNLFFKLYLLIAVLGAWTNASAQIIEARSISCPGANDGQLNVHSVWGTPPYTYAWTLNGNPIVADSIIKGANPGDYEVTVTDATLVDTVWTYTLQPAIPISINPITIANTTWPAYDGTLDVGATGGSNTYIYTVIDSTFRRTVNATGPIYNTLAPGNYQITVEDSHGCIAKASAIITDNSESLLSSITPTTITCYKIPVSCAVVPSEQDIFPVTAEFDDSVIDQAIYYVIDSNLVSGTPYAFNYIDSIRYWEIAVTNNVDTLLLLNTTPIITLGDASGVYTQHSFVKTVFFVDSVSVLQTLPDTSYYKNRFIGRNRILLASPSLTPVPLLEDGFHYAEYWSTDGKGKRASWDIVAPPNPVSINFTQTDITCYLGTNGAITANAQGSWHNYFTPYASISISGPGGFITALNNNNVSLANLTAGTYSITATDIQGCSRTQTVVLEQPDEPLRIVWADVINARCPYSLDGAANIHRIDGSVGAVSYAWSNGDTSPNLTDITPGTYILTVTDANGCTGQDSIKVEGERRNCFYNIVTPNGDGFNDYFDLSDFCVGVQMKAVIFNEAGNKVIELNENNPRWDGYDPALPPTGTSSTYTCFVALFENGVKTVEFAESFSVVHQQ